MNSRIRDFKQSANLAGEICNFSPGKLIRDFGLNDFLENDLQEEDDIDTIAIKALAFFCEDAEPRLEVFKFGVLCVGNYLAFAYGQKSVSQTTLKDLVQLLKNKSNVDRLRSWIAAHFH